MDFQQMNEFKELIVNDENKAKYFMEMMIDDILEKIVDYPDSKEKALISYKGIGGISLETIFKHAESPIEKLFLFSLLITSFKYHFLGVIIEAPVSDPLVYIKNKTIHYQNIISEYNNFHNKTKGNHKDFEEAILKNINLSEEEKRELNIDVYIYLGFDFYNKIHIMLQPCFNNIDRSGNSIRADLLIWCPAKPNSKLIIECDGYEYHSSKENFIKDRKRDRDFKANGMEVLRFLSRAGT